MTGCSVGKKGCQGWRMIKGLQRQVARGTHDELKTVAGKSAARAMVSASRWHAWSNKLQSPQGTTLVTSACATLGRERKNLDSFRHPFRCVGSSIHFIVEIRVVIRESPCNTFLF
ncbi:BQ5605_C009g05702 [Microbotryum silenes-dioicae]|uniref:BQ5605_C009g05702 protein n=1 Tax=Microbotryum silenes-dioicae TaxID=796604 RepID=A0A2X0MIH5_9BASI|nr:BQ5605_C009g05702 [Microbotryum silenes-dioicae]